MLNHAQHAVPAYRSDVFAPKKSEYCVCVFVINEGERIRRQLEKMKGQASVADIIIADGGSTDGSLDSDFLRESNVRALLTKTGQGRLSAQMRMAFDYALSEGYAGIIVMDGNDKDDPSAIPSFIRALESGCEFVQGSRFLPGGSYAHTPWDRLFSIRFIHAPLISVAARHRYTDTTNGFRAYARSFLLDERVQPFREVFNDYNLHYYLSITAGRLGCRTREIPVRRDYPIGDVPTKIKSWRLKLVVLKELLGSCLGAYRVGRSAR